MERNYKTCIKANYRLPCPKINIERCYLLIHSHREGFASSQARTTRRFWVMKQPNKAQDKIMILKPRRCDKKLECHDYHEGKTSGSVLHGLVYAHECALLVNFCIHDVKKNPVGRTGYPEKHWNPVSVSPKCGKILGYARYQIQVQGREFEVGSKCLFRQLTSLLIRQKCQAC